MARKIIPEDIRTKVLTQCRRRCAICFGLNRDTQVKQGQIAHIDKNRNNNKEDNLCFLCLNHHDQYDSSTSQSKNFTKDEVKQFKNELAQSINAVLQTEIQFGDVKVLPADPIVGQYIRIGGESDSAEITITKVPGNLESVEPRYHVSGLALWGTKREYGPNLGSLDFISSNNNNELEFSDSELRSESPYKIVINYQNSQLFVVEENWFGVHGVGVTFNGRYQKAS